MSQIAKRPLSNSSLPGDFPPDSALVSTLLELKPSHQTKKTKVDDASGQGPPVTLIPYPIHAKLRTAIDIKNALDAIRQLPKLGYCPTKVREFRDKFNLDSEYDPNLGKYIRFKDVEDSPAVKQQTILNGIGNVYKDIKDLSASHASGTFKFYSQYFRLQLRISRPGCEYDKDIQYHSKEITDLLHVWFEHAAVSGYGDMQSLETKVDCEVRNAREIPASEFEVNPEFLTQIQDEWKKRFLPRNVRAEPYKIHLYGPGGHFKSHRDTPETGLVGTFLVGLGDTSDGKTGHFRIANETFHADLCSWVAFHPDIPHEVTKLEEGCYRAVMAFKIFRAAETDSDGTLPAELRARIKTILDQISAPFGLFTTHQYSIGTTELNGCDALLAECAQSRGDTKVHMLPVVTTFKGEAFHEDPDESITVSSVYPFTEAHIDILLERDVVEAKKEVRWLKKLSNVPFYTWDLKASSVTWQEDYPNGYRYTGNQADSEREDSIYLSYALLCLPLSSSPGPEGELEAPDDPCDMDSEDLEDPEE